MLGDVRLLADQCHLVSAFFLHCSFKGSSHQSIADPGIATAMWGSPLGWVFSFVCLQICAPSDLCCSLGGCTLWITYIQFICPLASIRFGQWERHWQEIRGWEEWALLEVNFLPLPPPSSLPPGSVMQCLQSSTSVHCSCLVGQENYSSYKFLVTSPCPPSDHAGSGASFCWCFSLSLSLGGWLNPAYTFFFKYPL